MQTSIDFLHYISGVSNQDMPELMTINQASEFATKHIGKNVTPSNISYLINYGRIVKVGENGKTLVKKEDLIDYYSGLLDRRQNSWKALLGKDLNWTLSFEQIKEAETTKHVHRLHPYKGKFIPQLVGYFLDSHVDEFKKQAFFKSGDIILDPFCGSGTTLVQSSELGIHAIGVDISAFNVLISNVKVQELDILGLINSIQEITDELKIFVDSADHSKFEAKLLEELNQYNTKFFPSPEFKIKARRKEVNELEYARLHEKEVLQIFNRLVEEYGIKVMQDSNNRFLEKWYLQPVRDEVGFVLDKIEQVENKNIRDILIIILSRTIRSCRATTHADLATLLEPITTTYYCSKHGKICKPLFSILSWWERYSKDTVKRFIEFSKLRTNTFQICLNENSENADIFSELNKKHPQFYELVKKQKIKGIFSSPPYVGLIDYHEQHAYAYDLFGFDRRDDEEIGAMFKKQSKKAQQDYVNGVSNVLNNAKRFLVDDYDIFLVSNDKYNLYPQIAKNADMKIVNQYKRPVLNRTEKDKQAYCEIIFHLKAQ